MLCSCNEDLQCCASTNRSPADSKTWRGYFRTRGPIRIASPPTCAPPHRFGPRPSHSIRSFATMVSTACKHCRGSARVSRGPSASFSSTAGSRCSTGFAARPIPPRSSRPCQGSAECWPSGYTTISVSKPSPISRLPHTTAASTRSPDSAPQRLAGIRDSLAHRLGRVQLPAPARGRPSVAELLDVDREYRENAAADQLQRIAPRRFNPTTESWLPILHTRRSARRYTAPFSNTARAHRAGKTRDWVVLYSDNGAGESRHTVITAAFGPLRGRRVVAGREDECLALYQRASSSVSPKEPQNVANRRAS